MLNTALELFHEEAELAEVEFGDTLLDACLEHWVKVVEEDSHLCGVLASRQQVNDDLGGILSHGFGVLIGDQFGRKYLSNRFNLLKETSSKVLSQVLDNSQSVNLVLQSISVH